MTAPEPHRETSLGFLHRLRKDRRGISAVEFALIAPVMIVFYFGLAEFCQGYMSQKRLSHTASAVADLVAQSESVTTDNLDDIFAIQDEITQMIAARLARQARTAIASRGISAPAPC